MDTRNTLKYIKDKFGLRYLVPMPIQLPIDRDKGLSGLLNELGCKVGVEIGTQKGRYATWLFSRIKGLKLYCVDPWTYYEGYVEINRWPDQTIFDSFLEIAKKRLERKNVEFIRKYSMDAVNDFADESLDFVYIDGNHTFEWVIDDIAAWEKKVRPGGIVAGHDYRNSIDRMKEGSKALTPHERIKLIQVKTAMDAWTFANRIKPWFVTTATETDRSPSWFYVKK